MIKIIEGNILDCKEDVIGHQVNCLGVMSGGLAKQIKEKYLDVFICYSFNCGTDSSDDLLGHCDFIPTYDDKYIANLYGQNKTSRFRRMTDYKALEKS